MEFMITKRHVARGARRDAEMNNKMHLIENVSALRDTYRIRPRLYRAIQYWEFIMKRYDGVIWSDDPDPPGERIAIFADNVNDAQKR